MSIGQGTFRSPPPCLNLFPATGDYFSHPRPHISHQIPPPHNIDETLRAVKEMMWEVEHWELLRVQRLSILISLSNFIYIYIKSYENTKNQDIKLKLCLKCIIVFWSESGVLPRSPSLKCSRGSIPPHPCGGKFLDFGSPNGVKPGSPHWQVPIDIPIDG